MATQTTHSYNEIPYPTVPRFQTHPSRLAMLARLFGLNPPPVERCRVLDLGCGDGSNLIPMAYQLPQSEFVGLDLSAKQIAAGQAQIAALGLKNIRLIPLDIQEVGPELGPFDYIQAYGVYSWVAPAVQDKILDICKNHLTGQGVAYISYNVYPGWHLMGMVRELMLYQTRHVTAPYARAQKARQVLDFVVETMPALTKNPSDRIQANRLIWESVQALLRDQPDEYLLHDQLEAINTPLYLYQFIEQVERHGLQYLTDAEASAMLTAFLPADFAQSLQRVAQTELEVEQFMDFLYSRSFRQSLVCHRDVPLNREGIGLEQWRALYVASPARPVNETIEINGAGHEKFQGPLGTTIATDRPLHKAALLYLAEIWPQVTPFETLLRLARSRSNPAVGPLYSAADLAREAQSLAEILLKGYALSLVEIQAYRPAFVTEISDRPQASALARWQAQNGPALTNQRHEIVNLTDEVSRYLIAHLDGGQDRSALIGRLRALVDTGILLVQRDPAGEDAPLDEILGQVLQDRLQHLAREALLIS